MRRLRCDEVEEHYPDCARLMSLFDHEIVEDDLGAWRWKGNKLIRHITGPLEKKGLSASARATVSLNDLFLDFRAGRFDVFEYIGFHMDLSYSLSGFEELFCGLATEWKLPGAGSSETVIGWAINNVGKVNEHS